MNTDVDLSQLSLERDDRGDRMPRAGPSRHVVTRYVVPGLLVLGLLVLIAWAAHDLVFPPRQVKVVPVAALRGEARPEGTPLFKAAGWIEPRPTPVRVAAIAPGVVEQLLVVEDQAVAVGQPIAELVKQDAELALQRAQADLQLRDAELQVARATSEAATTRFEQPVHLEAILGEAESQLAVVETQLTNLPFETRRAESQLAFARKNYEGKASASDAVAGRVVAEAKSHHESAQALVEELRGRVAALSRQSTALRRRRDALQKQLELRTDERRDKEEAAANVQAAAARVQQTQVALAQAKLQVDRMTIRSPIDGRVLHLVAHPGSRLMVGRGYDGSHDASTVVTLYRHEMLQVRVDVRFEDLPRVQVGQPVSISSPAVATPLDGEVLLVSSEADVQKNTLEVKVTIASPPIVLKPEMLVEVTFLAAKSSAQGTPPSAELRLFLPQRLVQQGQDGALVWVADQSAGVARRTPVELGAVRADGLVEVTSGVNTATRLIASGHDELRDGQRIQVTGEATGPVTVPGRSQ